MQTPKSNICFLWHFTPPWRDRFDHSDWWTGRSAVSVNAARWEIIRRNPRVEAILTRRQPSPDKSAHKNDLEQFLFNFGVDSWPKLRGAQKAWSSVLNENLPDRRGHDPSKVHSLTAESRDVRRWSPPARLRLERGEPLEQVRVDEIARLAAEHHEAGRILIAIDPGMNPGLDDAGRLLQRILAAHRNGQSTDKIGRSHPAKWLASISKFEHDEMPRPRNETRNDVLFQEYRRVIESERWPETPETG